MLVLEPETLLCTRFVSVERPESVAFDPLGNLYVTTRTFGGLLVFDAQCRLVAKMPQQLSGPTISVASHFSPEHGTRIAIVHGRQQVVSLFAGVGPTLWEPNNHGHHRPAVRQCISTVLLCRLLNEALLSLPPELLFIIFSMVFDAEANEKPPSI